MEGMKKQGLEEVENIARRRTKKKPKLESKSKNGNKKDNSKSS